MGSTAMSVTPSAVQEGFEALERQRELIASCTNLWRELTDHFASVERGLDLKSDSLRSRRESLDLSLRRTLDSLRRREESIDAAVDLALAAVDSRRDAALCALDSPPSDDLPAQIRSLCAKMDSAGFFDLVVANRKEMEVLKSEIPPALSDCIDPALFAMDAISRVFPVDRRAVKSPSDLGWACVLVLESLVPALADPELGTARLLLTGAVKKRAKEMADVWKGGLQDRGGIEAARPQDVHAFLQHLVTFAIAAKEDKEFYKKLVMSVAWRKQIPKLALSLGLDDIMADMIDELISKGQQIDAINFAYETGLEDKFPAVPLLKSFLKDSKKVVASNSEDRSNSGQAVLNASRKKQSALRTVIKCIENRKLEAEFPIESLQKRLENLEKAKAEKKKPCSSGGGPANKRTRVNSSGPMPPAKAGRLTNSNAYVSSFPTFVRSPSAHSAYSAPIPPPYGFYGNRSPPAIRDPYAYPSEEATAAAIGVHYSPPPPPMNYPLYGGYQQVYYR